MVVWRHTVGMVFRGDLKERGESLLILVDRGSYLFSDLDRVQVSFYLIILANEAH